MPNRIKQIWAQGGTAVEAASATVAAEAHQIRTGTRISHRYETCAEKAG